MALRQRRFAWKLFWYFLLIIVIPLFIIGWYSQHAFRRHYLADTIKQLSSQSYLLSLHLEQAPGEFEIDSLCKVIGNRINTRITVIRKDGLVLGDSQNDPDTMENHSNRPEIIDAMQNSTGTSTRYSTTLQQNLLYFARPFTTGSKVTGIVRLALSVDSIRKVEKRFYKGIAALAAILLFAAALSTYLISRSMSKPLEAMKRAAQHFASGDLKFKLDVTGSIETEQLSKALNEMADQLHSRIQIITKQHNEQSAILRGMMEGVIAIDTDDKVILINDAAADLFKINRQNIQGKWIHEVIRNSELKNFLVSIRASTSVLENIFTFNSKDEERYLQVHGTGLYNAEGISIGALLVLNDITRLRLLENMRKEFVANVSHELRTPLTAIKGFVETLISENFSKDDQAQRFLSIISRKADHLCTIVEDILILAKVDKEIEKDEIYFEDTFIIETLTTARTSCLVQSAEKQLVIVTECDESLKWPVNSIMIEQAITNLLDNAIKYSDPGKEINIKASITDSSLTISVQDQGIGISPEHQQRIFERFYRVDKARSKKLGGTGLGLSIVKNIVLAHNGTISVQSEPGKGSTFSILLPRNLPAIGSVQV